MNLVEAYVAGVKELLALNYTADRLLYDALDDQLCDMWVDMDDKERAQATRSFLELRQRQ